MSDEEWPEGQALSAIDLEAANWCFRLIAAPSDTLPDEFRAWLAVSDANARAFANAMLVAPMTAIERKRIERLMGRTMPPIHRGHRTTQPISSGATIHAFPADGDIPRKAVSALPRNRRRWIGAAIAAAATIVLAVGLYPDLSVPSFLSPAYAKTFSTGHGEIRRFALSDGSQLTLDSDSRIEVRINGSTRHALLHSGRARIEVTADPRPFTIEVGNGDVVTTDGTIDIDLDRAKRVEVRLRSGSASVKPHDNSEAADAASLSLATDRPVFYAGGEYAPKVISPPEADTREWPSGWVEYRTISLGELVREANRYARTPIVLDDPQLASLTASGRFQLTATDRFAGRIAELFGLSVSRQTNGIYLRSPRQ